MLRLPPWVLTDRHPAFYDTESGTVIEQTARVYAAMQKLIDEYNAFVDSVNKSIEELKLETKEEQDCFKKCITELVETYIKSIDLKIDEQDNKLSDAIEDITANIQTITTQIVNDAIEAGTITITESYNPETESLEMTATGGV